MCRVAENAEQHARVLQPEPVHKVSTRGGRKTHKQAGSTNCKFCSTSHPMKRELCPAFGKTCRKCKGKNHFAEKCRASKRRINAVQNDDGGVNETNNSSLSDYESVATIAVNSVAEKSICAEMIVKGKPVIFQLDTGAAVNLISTKYVQEKLSATKTKLIMWNGAEMMPLGESEVKMINPRNGKKYAVKCVIVKEDLHPLLGATAIQKMGLLTVNEESFKRVSNVQTSSNIIQEFSDIFKDELGSLPGMIHLTVDPDVTPHISATRKIPVNLKRKIKMELDAMVEEGVIEQVNEPTDWVSSLTYVVKRNGKLRICIDPRPLNKALKREHFQLPTLDDILPDLSKAKIFSSVDLRNGFWHLKLDAKSSRLTTFSTPYGRYRWKVLPFGIAPAPEIFQKHVYNNICDLEGVLNVADDILVYGIGDTEAEAVEDHDRKLRNLFLRCRERGMRLNPDKLKLRQTSMNFLGHQVSAHGLCPDSEKVKALVEMPAPADVAGVQRLCGFVNYLARFLPHICDVMAPIRNLTKTNVPFLWSK